jgi:hypothetical protein
MDDVYIDMLEAAFPYINASLKRPAAALLKFQELNKVMRDYDTDEMIGACSLDSSSPNIELVLNAMKARATPEIAAQIDTLLNAMKMLKVYQDYQDLMNSITTPLTTTEKQDDTSSSNDMLSSLLNELIQKNNGGES